MGGASDVMCRDFRLLDISPSTISHLSTSFTAMLRHTRSISTIPPRRLSLLAHRSSSFFTPPPPPRPGASGEDPEDLEAEVNDREWEMRVARGMMHLRETLPLLFDPGVSSRDLFPKDVYSRNVNLKLPHPLGLRLPGLHAYGLAFTIARNGLQGESPLELAGSQIS